MSVTKYAELPRTPMKRLRIAFDVDGTLRCNCTNTCQDPNEEVVRDFLRFSRYKNTDMYVWSGGGADYARRFAKLFGLPVKDSHCVSKFNAPQMDICVDDIQETALAHFNLIVRNK